MKTIIYVITAWLLLGSCGEQFLEIKPDQKQRVPSTITDFQALMDNIDAMNIYSAHALGVIGGDEYYITDAQYNAFRSGEQYDFQKNAYSWEKEVYKGGEANGWYFIDWTSGYMRIHWANQVLDGLERIEPDGGQLSAWNLANGCAYFHRALNYYSLAQLYCPVFEAATSDEALGLPLRLEADLTLHTPRSNLRDTYSQIIGDLKKAADLLPNSAINKYRPSKSAVFSLLARLYLQIEDYEQAAYFASAALAIEGELLDFNTLFFSENYTFPANGDGNSEVIFMNTMDNLLITSESYHIVDSNLVSLYGENDLRLDAYFNQDEKNAMKFKGSYHGSRNFFTGLAVDELYLTRAEANARLNNLTLALDDLNHLLINRYASDTFEPIESDSALEILDRILTERRKELLFRGVRWEDIRRLNKDPNTTTSLQRKINGELRSLAPNDVRYVWPLPPEVIQYGGYQQNER